MNKLFSFMYSSQRYMLSLMLVLCTTAVFADNVTLDGINYVIWATSDGNGKARVCKSPDATGNVTIPFSFSLKTLGTIYFVEEMEAEVFKDNKNITSVYFKNNVHSIPDEFFSGCENLKSVTGCGGISYLGKEAFYGCKSLESVDISSDSNYSTIYQNTFYGCSSLKSFNIPNSVTIIGENAFNGCSSLESATFPKGLAAIGQNAFKDCSKIASASFSSSLTTIATQAFYHCTALSNVTFAEGLTKIGEFAFEKCNMKSITIPESVTSIGNGAFSECSNLEKVTLHSGLTEINRVMFSNCSKLTTIINFADSPQSTVQTDNIKTFKNVDLSKVNLYVKSNSVNDFKNCEYAWKDMIIHPLSFSKDGLYYNITSDTDVELTFKTLEGNPYNYEIEDITIPSTVEYTDLTFNVTAIAAYAFKLSSTKTITIPSSVKTVGSCAFYECSKLTSVNIPSGVKNIPDHTFYHCYKITEIIIPSAVTSIGEYAFCECTGLKKVTCKGSTPPVADASAFYNISNIGNIWLSVPETAKSNYQTANVWKEFLFLPGNSFKVGNLYYEVTSPSTVCVTQAPYTDKPAENANLVIPETITYEGRTYDVTTIGISAFSTAKFASLTIPSTIKNIENFAFYSSTIPVIINYSKVPQSVGDITLSTTTNVTFYVYDSCLDTYKTTTGWSNQNLKGLNDQMTDDKEYSNTFDAENIDVSYTRNFTNTNWQALYLPFCMKYDDWKDDFEIAELYKIEEGDIDNDGINETYLVIKKIEDATIQNRPYLIKAKTTGSKTIKLDNTTLYRAEVKHIGQNGYNFYGTYTPVTTMYTNGYYGMADGMLTKVTSDDVVLKPYRWYLKIESTSNSKIYLLEDGETPTSINNAIANRQHDEGPCYNINGQRVNQDTKGIIIKNGKKIVVK